MCGHLYIVILTNWCMFTWFQCIPRGRQRRFSKLLIRTKNSLSTKDPWEVCRWCCSSRFYLQHQPLRFATLHDGCSNRGWVCGVGSLIIGRDTKAQIKEGIEVITSSTHSWKLSFSDHIGEIHLQIMWCYISPTLVIFYFQIQRKQCQG